METWIASWTFLSSVSVLSIHADDEIQIFSLKVLSLGLFWGITLIGPAASTLIVVMWKENVIYFIAFRECRGRCKSTLFYSHVLSNTGVSLFKHNLF